MLKKILVPLDGSAFAETALASAVALARRDGAEFFLLTVVPPPVPSVYLEGAVGVAAAMHDQAEARAVEYLSETAERTSSELPGIEIHRQTVVGRVVESIDGVARDAGIDLIVMSSHGRGPFQRMWLGSVADGVMRHAPAPVLLVRPHDGADKLTAPVGQYDTVMIPIDGSPVARDIIPCAVDVAGRAAHYHVIRVAVPRLSARTGHLPDPRDDPPDPAADRRRVQELLDKAVQALRDLDVTDVSQELVSAQHVASEIIERADSLGISLVAMSTHGAGGVARLLLGSTTDKVARGVHCPVLVHRAPGGHS